MIIEQIKNEFMILNQKHIDETTDAYDFWNNHVKYVVSEALELAKKYGADLEIVELGAILHDIALVAMVGSREKHHIAGAKMARILLKKYNYPQDKIERVANCVLNHRSSYCTETIEETCVADADIISHFYNIPMAFIYGVKDRGMYMTGQFLNWFKKDYYDLSDQTKIVFKDRYNQIMKFLFDEKFEEI